MRRRIPALICAAFLCVTASSCERVLPLREGSMSILLALERDCPSVVVEVFEEMCDDVLTLSDGTLQLGLQFCDDAIASRQALAFVQMEDLAGESQMYEVPSLPFMFSSTSQARLVMNASDVHEVLSEALREQDVPYQVQSVLFCGRTFLLTGDEEIAEALKEEDDAYELIPSLLGEGEVPLRPADFTHAPENGVFYTARTDELFTVPNGVPNAYLLIDTTYRAHFGMLLEREGLYEQLGPARYAALVEAAAAAVPACADAYEQMADQILAAAQRTSRPTSRLRRITHGQVIDPEYGEDTAAAKFYRVIADYTL